MKITRIIGIFLILIGIAFIIYYIPFIKDVEVIEKEVDCFDKYRNKIVGQKCIENSFPKLFFSSACLIAFFLAAGLFLLTKNWGEDRI